MFTHANILPYEKPPYTEVVGHFDGNLWEFYMRFNHRDGGKCECYLKKRIKHDAPGLSHYRPDAFITLFPREPLLFENWSEASHWWNIHKEDFVQELDLSLFDVVEHSTTLLEEIPITNGYVAVYRLGDGSFEAVQYMKELCGHTIRSDWERRYLYRDLTHLREDVAEI